MPGSRSDVAPSPTEAWARLLASAGLAASLTVLVGAGVARADSPYEHIVQRGDTLWSIALQHDVSIQELIEFNELPNPNLIHAGQRLLIPSGEAASTPAPSAPTAAATTEILASTSEAAAEWLPDLFRINQYCIQGRMSNGQWVHEGAVAAPGGLFPLGTVVEIEGLGSFTVEDRMGWSSNPMLDVWTPICRDAFIWGTRFRRVRVLSGL